MQSVNDEMKDSLRLEDDTPVHSHHPERQLEQSVNDEMKEPLLQSEKSRLTSHGRQLGYSYCRGTPTPGLQSVFCGETCVGYSEPYCYTVCNCFWYTPPPHGHSPHGHRPHGHSPHGHNPHTHTPHIHLPPPPPPPPAPPPFAGSLTWTPLFIVGTSASEANKFYISDSSRSDRSIPFSDGENSVAVSVLRYYDIPVFRFAFCFANTNARNRCYKHEIDSNNDVNQMIPDLTDESTVHTTTFGNVDEFTVGIELVDLNGECLF